MEPYSHPLPSIAEDTLTSAWSALENFHEYLVVIGGLAIHFHTRDKVEPFYRPASTLDVDFGISLGAEAGMCMAAWDLASAGFKETAEKRVYRESENGKLYVDFLTEHPPSERGTRNVSDLVTSVCPGINSALKSPIKRAVIGRDSSGEMRNFQVPFANYGSLLVLKLNAFSRREGPKKAKDAYDVLTLVLSNSDSPEAAIESFLKEKSNENQGMKSAIQTLENSFSEREQDGALLASSFINSPSRDLRLREDLVSVGRALLDC